MNDALSAVQQWNASNPPGSPVTHTFGDGRTFDEVTASDAFRRDDIPMVYLVGKKHPVGLKGLRRRVLVDPPDMVAIVGAVTSALPEIPDGFDLTVRLTLVDASGVDPVAFVQTINL